MLSNYKYCLKQYIYIYTYILLLLKQQMFSTKQKMYSQHGLTQNSIAVNFIK